MIAELSALSRVQQIAIGATATALLASGVANTLLWRAWRAADADVATKAKIILSYAETQAANLATITDQTEALEAWKSDADTYRRAAEKATIEAAKNQQQQAAAFRRLAAQVEQYRDDDQDLTKRCGALLLPAADERLLRTAADRANRAGRDPRPPALPLDPIPHDASGNYAP